MTVEVFQRNPPKKSHIVSEQVDESTIVTKCGLTFEDPNGPINTFEYDPSEAKHEQTYIPPIQEARCNRCSWDEE